VMIQITQQGAAGAVRRGLESTLAAFADLPPEAVLKEDLLRLGVSFSAGALGRSGAGKSKSYFIFSFDHVPIADMEQGENSRAPEEIALEGGPGVCAGPWSRCG